MGFCDQAMMVFHLQHTKRQGVVPTKRDYMPVKQRDCERSKGETVRLCGLLPNNDRGTGPDATMGTLWTYGTPGQPNHYAQGVCAQAIGMPGRGERFLSRPLWAMFYQTDFAATFFDEDEPVEEPARESLMFRY